MNPPSPRLFDPQVNGYAGVDFQRDDLTLEALRRAALAWRRDGGDQFFLTLITDAWPRLLARLRRLRAWRDSDPELRQVIAGWHVEGPFLSDQPGYRGAHDPTCMEDPHPDHMRQLREALGSDAGLLTLAPERAGAIAAIRAACERGIRVSLGHTNASARQLREAVDAGATGFTHLANGCPQQLDRHDNILWRVLDAPGLIVGLIADGLHVAPAPFRLFHRLLPPERIYYTTDAMAAAGAPPGDFTLGRLCLRVGEDGIVRQPGATNFAGSSLTPAQLLERVHSILGRDASSVVPRVLQTARAWLTASRPP